MYLSTKNGAGKKVVRRNEQLTWSAFVTTSVKPECEIFAGILGFQKFRERFLPGLIPQQVCKSVFPFQRFAALVLGNLVKNTVNRLAGIPFCNIPF